MRTRVFICTKNMQIALFLQLLHNSFGGATAPIGVVVAHCASSYTHWHAGFALNIARGVPALIWKSTHSVSLENTSSIPIDGCRFSGKESAPPWLTVGRVYQDPLVRRRWTPIMSSA